jgi:tripartite-type tricarboxylate transporter receptor subunit TctC
MADHARVSRRAALQGAGALGLAASALCRPAAAAAYPERPVRIVVPFAAGGPSDLTARLMSVELGQALGQTFIVENRPGAGSNLGTAAVARSAPDGYTLLVTSSAFVVNPGLYKQVSPMTRSKTSRPSPSWTHRPTSSSRLWPQASQRWPNWSRARRPIPTS